MTKQKQEHCDSALSYLKNSHDKRDELYAKCIETLENMTSLSPEHIHVPIMRNKEDYEKYVVKNFIRCGAIPKKDLVIGKTYIGSCRNAGEAVWLGKQFEYDRYKATDINNVDARRFNYLTFLSSPNTKGMVLGDVVNDNGKFIFDLAHFDRLGGRILLDSVCIPNIMYEKTIAKGTRCFTLNELDMPIHTDNILVFKRDKYNNKILFL